MKASHVRSNALKRNQQLQERPGKMPAWLLLLLSALPTLLIWAPSVIAAPTVVASDVSSVAQGMPTFNDPLIVWATIPLCSNVPGDELEPALFTRGSANLAPPRVIFSFNPSRPVGTCNPYRLLSDMVSDGSFLYFIDNQGPSGNAVLWRRSRDSNPQDPSALVVDLGTSVDSGELLLYQTVVFVIIHRTGQEDVMLEYDKTTGAFYGTVETAEAGTMLNMQTDGRFLYWVNGSLLRRDDLTNGVKATVVTGGVSSYFLEGFYDQCIPGAGCQQESWVVYAQENQLFEKETIGDNLFLLYTSASPNATISHITRDGISYFASTLYFIERRPVPAGGFDREDRFFRLSAASTVPDLLYGPINNGGPGFDGFTTDGTYLYFRERVDHTLLRLPNDAPSLPIYKLVGNDLEITQGIQNRANQDRLIAGKRTFVRFYVHSGDSRDVPGVTALLQGDSQTAGFLGTLAPTNQIGKLITVRPAPNRSNLNESFLFELPLSWTTAGSLSLTATVNPLGGVVEDDFEDNTASESNLTFSASPRLPVHFIRWMYDLYGAVQRTDVKDVAAAVSYIRRAFPLESTGGSPFTDGPGLRFDVTEIFSQGLGGAVGQTRSGCVDNLCGSAYANSLMSFYQASGRFPKEHYMSGLIPDPTINAPPNRAFPRGQASGMVSSGPSWLDYYVAHEIGHCVGASHPALGIACGHSLDDTAYPYALSLIGPTPYDDEQDQMGFDAGTLSGSVLPGNEWYDVMSYCRPNWISDYTSTRIFDFLTANETTAAQRAVSGTAAAVAGDWLVAVGDISPAVGTATLQHVARLDSLPEAPEVSAGDYALRLVSGTGATLAEHPFAATPLPDDPTGTLSFVLATPFSAGTRTVQVVDLTTNSVLGYKSVSPSPPVVSNVQLPGAPDPVVGTLVVTWTASDPDGDPLSFDLLVSRDGGVTYRPLVLSIPGTSLNLDTSGMGGGTTVLRVVASDGVNTAHTDSAPFAVEPKAPVPVIVSPSNDQQVQWNQLVTFEAEALDSQDEAIPDSSFHWLTQYGDLGTGRVLQTDTLEVGTNTVILEVTNSMGLTATASITVIVGDELRAPGPKISVAPTTISWHVASGETSLQTAELDVSNAGSGSLLFDAKSDAEWLLVDGYAGVTGASTPFTLQITADPSQVPPGVTGVTLITLQSLVNPDDFVTIPVSLSKGNVFSTGSVELLSFNMPLPESQLIFAPAPASTPVLNSDPALANPIGLGAVATGGDTLNIRIGTTGFSGPADVYFAVFSPQVLGGDIFLYNGGTFVTFSQAGLVPWIASTTGPLDQDLFGTVPLSLLPSGAYTLYFAVAPAGSPLATFYIWSAAFTVP